MMITDLMMVLIIAIISTISFIGITGNISLHILEKYPNKLNTKLGQVLFKMVYYLEIQEKILSVRV
ncbi:hypothetical protein [Romboutsia ilealis]|uniref:hypothetical protein n=1 Tax=Romboutsia ilealis TaxID=1115758 RepID=UPI00272CA25F|nr:hypothetical protein [Romboutsia ilealis]